MMEIQGKSILIRVSEGSSYRESTVYQNPEWLFYLIMDKAGIPSINQNSEQMHVSDAWRGKTPTSNSQLLLFEVLLLIGRLIGQSQSIVKQYQSCSGKWQFVETVL